MLNVFLSLIVTISVAHSVHAESFTCAKGNGRSVEGRIIRQGFGEFIHLYYLPSKIRVTAPVSRYEDPNGRVNRLSFNVSSLRDNYTLEISISRTKNDKDFYFKDIDDFWFEQCQVTY